LPTRRPVALLALLAFVSGAAGLIYEIAWARQLALQVGSLLPALSALLAAHLLGLTLGSAVAGRIADRSARPLAGFALCEILTAAFGLLVGPGLIALDPLWTALYRLESTDRIPFPVIAGALGACLVLPAAACMGATLPYLVAAARPAQGEAGATSGRLYSANTMGGVVGTALCGFVLLPVAGISLTTVIAAGLNLLAAAASLPLARVPHPSRATGAAPSSPGRALPLGFAVGLGLVGAGSMGAQLAWTRALSLLLASSLLATTCVLAAILCGYALGGRLGAALAQRVRIAAHGIATCATGFAAAAVAGTALLGVLPLAIVPLATRAQANITAIVAVQAGAAMAIVFLPTLLLGLCFPLAVRLRAADGCAPGRATGEVYAAGSAGFVVGAIAFAGGALPLLGARGALFAAAGLAPLGALLLTAAQPQPRRAAAIATAGVLLTGAAFLLPGWDPQLMTSGPALYARSYHAAAAASDRPLAETMRHRGEIVFHREGAGADVTVRRSPTGVLSLQIDGKTDASTGGDMVTQLLAGHLPALLAPPRAASALLIGLASGVSLGALVRHPFTRIDCIELVPAVAEAAAWFEGVSGAPLRDPRVRLRLGDGRNHLRHASDRYDVIASQPTNPWVTGAAALFTGEAFVAARDRLTEGGVFCQWLQGYALPREDLRRVVATFLEVFPSATLWEESAGGGDYFLVGWRNPEARLDADLLRERLRVPGVAGDLARAGVEGLGDLLAHFVAGPEALARFSRGARAEIDDRVDLEYAAVRALHVDTLPDQIRGLRPFRESPAGVLVDLDHQPDRAALLKKLRLARIAARSEERLLLSLPATGTLVADPELELGIELLRAGLGGPALAHLQAAAHGSARPAEAWALAGALHLASGSVEAAEAELREAVRQRPGDVASRALLARAAIARGDGASARLEVAQALSLDPAAPDLLNLLGAAALLANDPAGALAPLSQAVTAEPELVEGWINLGVARRQMGDLPGARTAYARALAVDPGNVDAQFNLAVAALVAGDKGEAAALFLAVLRVDPEYPEAQRWLEAASGGQPAAADSRQRP
jgi:spermidine synthase